MSKRKLRAATHLVHGGVERSIHGETAEAIYLSSGFSYDRAETVAGRFRDEIPGYLYSRYGNPTCTMLETRAAQYEGAGRCCVFSSGMAAVTAVLMTSVRAGDHVLAARSLFGNCRYVIETFLPRYGIETTMVDETDISAWKQGIRSNTKTLFFETPTNPTLNLVDIEAVSNLAHEVGAMVVVDNAFASPVAQRPLDLGADIVVYSATKHIDGQGRCLGGLALGDEKFISEELFPYIRNIGPSLSPFNAWVMLKSYETLELRVRAMSDNAAILADFLADQPEISCVRYPTRSDHPQYELAKKQMIIGSSIVSFEVKGGADRAFRFLDALQVILISNNLGDTKTLAVHPASTTHSKLSEQARLEVGITPSTVRLSVGLEDVRDLQDDISIALGQSS